MAKSPNDTLQILDRPRVKDPIRRTLHTQIAALRSEPEVGLGPTGTRQRRRFARTPVAVAAEPTGVPGGLGICGPCNRRKGSRRPIE